MGYWRNHEFSEEIIATMRWNNVGSLEPSDQIKFLLQNTPMTKRLEERLCKIDNKNGTCRDYRAS
jgi:hypothetical protein